MIQYYLSFCLALLCASCATTQSTEMTKTPELPYHQIPDAPASYDANAVAARMIDGLGYRFYWATEGLVDGDMEYKISEDSRSFGETMSHLYGLSTTTLNAVKSDPNVRPSTPQDLTWKQKRDQTLMNLKEASDLLRVAEPDAMKDMKIIFQRGDKVSEFPFWYALNGPIADAMTHVGQILAFRRANGNPQPSGVNVFTGKTF